MNKIVLLSALTLCITTASVAMKKEKQHKEPQELKDWVIGQQKNKNTRQEKQHKETQELKDLVIEQQRKLKGNND